MGRHSPRSGQKLGQKFAIPHPPSQAESARVRALRKLPGLDSNQQPSG